MTGAEELELPQSVFRYLTDPQLRAGVESVLEYRTKKLPPGLEWDELGQYFRAAVAASSVQADWALALGQLWRCVWPDQLVGWSPVSVDEQATREFDAHVSIDKCWSEEWFGRCFTRPAAPAASTQSRRKAVREVLCLGVSITLDGASVGISLDPSPAAAPDPMLFHYDDDAAAWWSVEQVISSPTLDLSALQQAALQALKWAARSENSEM